MQQYDENDKWIDEDYWSAVVSRSSQTSSSSRRLSIVLLKNQKEGRPSRSNVPTLSGSGDNHHRLGSMVINSLKWFTVAACVTRYLLSSPAALEFIQQQEEQHLNQMTSSLSAIVNYPSRQHSQFRLMVAGYVTARVVLASLRPQFSFQPTPNVQLFG